MAFGVAVSGSVQAASSHVRFHIEPKRTSEALLDLAQQANVTLIGAAACAGYSQARIATAMTVEQALDQLLSGAPCVWKMLAPGAVEISALPRTVAAGPAPVVAVSELLVTATKRVRDPRQLAVSMTAVSGKDLQATAASDAAEGAAQLNLLSTNLGPGRDKLLLRGLSDGAYTGRARSTVATYLDDIPINYNAPDPDLRLVDVERVEIARGPQSTLYGAGFLSGLYRIVSHKPDLGAFSDRGAHVQGHHRTRHAQRAPSRAISTRPSGTTSRACASRPTTSSTAATSTTCVCRRRTPTAPNGAGRG